MKNTMTATRVGALLFLILALVYGYNAYQIPLQPWSMDEPFTSRTLPIFLSAIGSIVALLMLILPDNEAQSPIESFSGPGWKVTLALLVLMSLFGVALKPLGFLVSTTLFLLGGYWLLGERRIQVLLLASLPVAIGLWFLLSKVLGIYLAPGELFV
ncbi:MAG: tripartite tricarboxylate transporter TctB family protein [Endozoicomonas sp.]|uniref:tripartite tricarboxylate transporter TctB family protein n=1 Tax=Endozoicomonas sp. TaxID=1892382 RepID=UPI003D9B3F85